MHRAPPPPPPPSRDRGSTELQARELNQAADVLVNLGIRTIKRNPIPTGLYVLGILICLLFSGFTPQQQQIERYDETLQKLDPVVLDEAEAMWYRADMQYRQSAGWFTCNNRCQENKRVAATARQTYDKLLKEHDGVVRDAKSALGLFSTFGVQETRNLFWKRFAQGRGFAQTQSKWDALFMGIGAMARDEKLASYFMRVLINLALNFTIGVFGAVVAFVWGLWGVIASYKADPLSALAFFSLAALAAIAFAMTWIIGLYAATAGTAYVGLKFLATNVRIDNGYDGRERRRHIN